MKKLYFTLLVTCWTTFAAIAQNAYFFPKHQGSFDPAIPTPEQFLGYPIGSHYTRHDQLVAYFKELDRLSDKVSFQIIGKTYEERPQVILTITSPANHARLEQIRKEHLSLIDPKAAEPNYQNMPAVVHLGYSVHGNETSSGESAILTAYYLTASQSEETQRWLDEAVVTIDPALNPDGRDRAANFHNQYKSFPPVADPLDREHNEVWPMGRTNHFWFDLNRDWLATVHVESKNRVDFFQQWYPNIMIDFHEMGTNSTYYFEPTPPLGSESPVLPRSVYEDWNVRLAKYHVDALDGLGVLYFTKEQYDNFSPIYGGTYPDFHGAVGVTFEIGSSRGLVQESQDGLKTFALTIRNHTATGLATVRGGVAEREFWLKSQRDFFKSALTDAAKNPNKAFIFGNAKDRNLTNRFLELALRHKVEVYENSQDLTLNGKTFAKGSSYFIPTAQPQYRIVHSLFEEMTTFVDSVFYDITGYSVAHGYGVSFAPLKTTTFSKGNRVTQVPTLPGGVENGKSEYGYLFSWNDINASKLLYQLQSAGVMARAAFKPFSVKFGNAKKEFSYGSIFVPMGLQSISSDSLYKLVDALAKKANIPITGVSTGFSVAGIDLGSANIRTTKKPEVALLIGEGVAAGEAGEAWFVLNMYAGIPVTKIDVGSLRRADLNRYTTLVMVSGTYNFDPAIVNKLKNWVENGGTLITYKTAAQWAVNQGIVSEKLLVQNKVDSSNTKRFDFVNASEMEGTANIGGAILRANLDVTNPIGFGLEDRNLYTFRNSRLIFKPSMNPYATVAKYPANPVVSGFVSKDNAQKLANSAAIVVSNAGSGRVVLFADNPNFRGYWHGTARLFLNAVFFGNLLTVPSALPAEEED
jgi:hypothetical protein